MHEYGIVQSVVDSVLKKIEKNNINDTEKITSLKLRVGKLNMLGQESLQNAFDIVAKDTMLSGAKLEVEDVDGSEITVVEVFGESKKCPTAKER